MSYPATPAVGGVLKKLFFLRGSGQAFLHPGVIMQTTWLFFTAI